MTSFFPHRRHRRSQEPTHAIVELGHEPPIEAATRPRDPSERGPVSVPWLAAALLTSVAGLALLGSALYLGLDGKSTFAEAPEFAQAPNSGPGEGEGLNPKKADRLYRPVDLVAAKQTFKTLSPLKFGDKEVMKSRSFSRLTTTLATSATGLSDAVPAYDPLKITNGSAEAPEPAAPDASGLPDEAGFVFAVHEMTAEALTGANGELSPQEVQAQVAEAVKQGATVAGDVRSLTALGPQLMLMRTSHAADALGTSNFPSGIDLVGNAPFSAIEVKMFAENIVGVPRNPAQDSAFAAERLAAFRHGETFEEMLRENGASPESTTAILSAFGMRRGDSPVDGRRVTLQFDPQNSRAKKPVLGRVSIYEDDQLKAAVGVDDSGAYVAVTGRKSQAKKAAAGEEGSISLYQSLFETGLKQGLPRPLIEEIIRAFANDVDYQRPVAVGDSLDAFFTEPDELDLHQQLLTVTLTVRDQAFKYYRFQAPDDNSVDFYDENGRSTRKFLIRKPIANGEMTSGFGFRYHPILHYNKMHTGIDWAAAIGTPILAAGNGIVLKAEYTSGYGRRVEIQHSNGYVTTYNHMSGFGRGMAPGARVTQGQVVGFLGQSGQATGPHLHYEVMINGNFVDPMAIRLARTREFDGKLLAAFKRERERVDQLIAQTPTAAAARAQAKIN